MKGKVLYITLISGTAIIISIMLLIDYRQQAYEKKLLTSAVEVNKKFAGDNIDSLLLSAEDLSMTEKKAFINIYLKSPQQLPETGKKELKDKRDALYYSILQRRINRSASKPQEDFSVKPVPK